MYKYQRMKIFGLLIIFTGFLLSLFSLRGWSTPWAISIIATLLGIGVFLFTRFTINRHELGEDVNQ